ncbi:MAG: hypothetical protein KGL42_08590, partial [Betaproteobacteria bacterium]|nr:hypothetical protein [Betaproteobacteria bacterium]
ESRLNTRLGSIENQLARIETELPHKAGRAWILSGLAAGAIAIIGAMWGLFAHYLGNHLPLH